VAVTDERGLLACFFAVETVTDLAVVAVDATASPQAPRVHVKIFHVFDRERPRACSRLRDRAEMKGWTAPSSHVTE